MLFIISCFDQFIKVTTTMRVDALMEELEYYKNFSPKYLLNFILFLFRIDMMYELSGNRSSFDQ